jgi:GntR family transcriptional regulator
VAWMRLNLTDLSDESLQSQIVRQIRTLILSNDLPADSALPSIRNLAREHRVSVITVQRAYERLFNQNLIYSRRGKGFFVSNLEIEQRDKLMKQRLIEKLDAPCEDALAEGLMMDEILDIVRELLRKKTSNRGTIKKGEKR